MIQKVTWSVPIVAGLLLVTPGARADLIAAYTFNDGTATDVSGHGNNGTFSPNAPTFTAAGYQGGAFDFNASQNNFITIPVNINPANLPQITMGGWFNADVANAVVRGLLSHDSGGFDRTLDIDTRGGSGVRWSAFTGSGVLGGTPVVTGVWTFLAMRHDQSTGTLTLDIEGNRITIGGASFGSGLTTTTIGRNPNFDSPFDGRIDNIFLFDEFLSNTEIDRLRSLGQDYFVIPEPSTFALSGLGTLMIVGATFARRRRIAC